MTITLTREEAQQVLDALELVTDLTNHDDELYEAIETLRARLAQPEPVAVWELQEGGWDTIADADWMESLPIGTKLYTAPPQREEGCAECGKKSSDGWALYCVKCSECEWQGLTDDEREKATGWSVEHIEAELKKKNTL
jgi:hypothetical protein